MFCTRLTHRNAYRGLLYTARLVCTSKREFHNRIALSALQYSKQIHSQTPNKELGSTAPELKPHHLYKIISATQWTECLAENKAHLPRSSNDRDFIHLSTCHQVEKVIAKFWLGQAFVVLEIATQQLPGLLVYEKNPGGQDKYYHLYNGAIPVKNATLFANSLESYQLKKRC